MQGSRPSYALGWQWYQGHGLQLHALSLPHAMLCPAGGSGTQVIVSSHNYERTPEDSELQKLQNEIFNFDGTAVGKIAAMARDIGDAERLLRLLDSPGAAPGRRVLAFWPGQKAAWPLLSATPSALLDTLGATGSHVLLLSSTSLQAKLLPVPQTVAAMSACSACQTHTVNGHQLLSGV